MTIVFTLLNDDNNQPAVYSDRPDLNAFTLTVTTDSTTPIAIPQLRLGFPLTIFTLDQIAKITVTSAGWNPPTVGGPFVTLTPTTAQSLVKGTPLVVKLGGISSTNPASTTDVVQLFAGSEAPSVKFFLMQYPSGAGDLTKMVDVKFEPATVYRTPENFDTVENVLTLRLINKQHDSPLVTKPWVSTPTVTLSFVYGNDIGSLTPADPQISDPHSAYNIDVEVIATYKDGQRTYEWKATQPGTLAAMLAAELTAEAAQDQPPPSPVWTLQPVPENRDVLGAGAGATAEFRISGLSTSAPKGSTLAYLQFTSFPGFSDCYFAIPLEKAEPVPAIVYFDGVPNYVEAPGGTVKLSWQTLQMARVALQQDGELLPGPFDVAHGEYSTPIERTTDFALMAFIKSGDTQPAHTAQWTAHVPDAEVLSFTADGATVADGSPVTVSWTTRNALSGTIDSGGVTYNIPTLALNSGSKVYYPRKPTTYVLQLTGQGDPPAASVPVFVLPRGWAPRGMGFQPGAGEGPVLYGSDAGLTLVGGNSDNAIFQSTDGVTWSQTAVANFPARSSAAGCAFGGKSWIAGGQENGVAANDVWSSTDGVSWTQATAAAPWRARSNFTCIGFAGKLWVFGGLDANLAPLGDIWSSSDGAAWTKVTDTAAWSARSAAAVTEHKGSLYLFGGLLADGSVSDELWSSTDGAAWRRESSGSRGGGPPARQAAALFSLKGALYLFGGLNAAGNPSPDFREYKNPGWGLLSGPSRSWAISNAGVAVWRDALWIAGGYDGGAQNANVWSFFPG
ncbi:MAG TPA: hypothetical protein VN694_03150 [Caulobacteraceae bacterium]|nr:hypothetical protein [Caulobacteraceae bacterium]